RAWQSLSSIEAGDATLSAELAAAAAAKPESAILHNALGVVLASGVARVHAPPDAAGARVDTATPLEAFRQAVAANFDDVVAGANLAEELVLVNDKPAAIDQARRVLQRIELKPEAPAKDTGTGEPGGAL